MEKRLVIKTPKTPTKLRRRLKNLLSDDMAVVIMDMFTEYNLEREKKFDKCRRERDAKVAVTVSRISGALSQCIDNHGPVTQEFVSSAAKRIQKTVLNTMLEEYGKKEKE